MSGFALKQLVFAADPPTVARLMPILTNHSTAGNHNRGRIGGASAGHSANRLRSPNRTCHLAVGPSGSVGNAPQLFPDSPLKGGRLNVGWQVQIRLLTAQMRQNPLDPLAKAPPLRISATRRLGYQRGTGILLPQLGLESCVRLAKINRTNPRWVAPAKRRPNGDSTMA